MNREAVIRMAKEAGVSFGGHPMNPLNVYVEDLIRFADLVAAAEREECAKVCGEEAANAENSEQYRMGANWARERIRARSNV